MKTQLLISRRCQLHRIDGGFLMKTKPFMNSLEFRRLIEVGYGFGFLDIPLNVALGGKGKRYFSLKDKNMKWPLGGESSLYSKNNLVNLRLDGRGKNKFRIRNEKIKVS